MTPWIVHFSPWLHGFGLVLTRDCEESSPIFAPSPWLMLGHCWGWFQLTHQLGHKMLGDPGLHGIQEVTTETTETTVTVSTSEIPGEAWSVTIAKGHSLGLHVWWFSSGNLQNLQVNSVSVWWNSSSICNKILGLRDANEPPALQTTTTTMTTTTFTTTTTTVTMTTTTVGTQILSRVFCPLKWLESTSQQDRIPSKMNRSNNRQMGFWWFLESIQYYRTVI